ncbi:thiamine kinase-like enzyme [Roseibium hamelinense]|uniref:Thiamine kinase-like enzyme n=1 Tax=Roseibium hamelinense TaxID=150831 RepID=A0A562T8X8_9HYPH|nr:choline kinase family protein [Roseibium hamelinense]TWI90029.1 thiamine kinase-like enzyme [Roseibium hamelinense]
MSISPLSDVERAFAYFPHLKKICGDISDVRREAGLTNRVFRVACANGTYILRLPRAETAGAVDRVKEAHNHRIAAQLGIAPVPLYSDPNTGVQLSAALPDEPLDARSLAEKLGAVLTRLHSVPKKFRWQLVPQEVIAGQQAYFSKKADLAQRIAPLIEALADTGALQSRPDDFAPCHGDLSPGNILYSAGKLVLIDWEYSGQCEPAWDLAYAALENDFEAADEKLLLDAYSGGTPPDSLVSRFREMKSVCDAVSASWALAQVAAGRDPATFLAFAQMRIDRAQERIGLV